MRTLHRYLVREMLATVAMAVGVCTGLLLLGNLLKEILALLMSGQATLGLVLRSIGLLIPFVLTFALPMGALTAALLVFGRLSADSELTAARANGISLMALAMPVILLSLGICGVCAWINLDVGPRCRVAYKGLFTEIARERARALLPAGRFVTDFPGYVLYANRVEADQLDDVLCFQLKDGRKISDIRAPSARIEVLSEQRKIRLTFIEPRALHWLQASPRTNESADTNLVAEPGADPLEPEGTWVPLTMGEEVVEIPLPPAIASGGLPALGDMTWSQLLSERRELRKLGIEEATPLDVQLHRQMAFSFASFGFALVGIPLGVRAHRRETSVGIAFAILLVLVYYAFLIVAQALETRPETAPWLIVWLPNIVFQLSGGWLLWRANRG
ncbi:MAG: LptF/LptG family permease [Verrucomicrobiales bacterium]|nr:LptF/LptG family permease [Verrucomicrobiales bacterium]